MCFRNRSLHVLEEHHTTKGIFIPLEILDLGVPHISSDMGLGVSGWDKLHLYWENGDQGILMGFPKFYDTGCAEDDHATIVSLSCV